MQDSTVRNSVCGSRDSSPSRKGSALTELYNDEYAPPPLPHLLYAPLSVVGLLPDDYPPAVVVFVVRP